MPQELNIAVFASGRGSNFQAILEALEKGKISHAAIGVVISNNSDAGALEIARTHGIPAVHLSRKQFGSDQAFNDSVLQTLDRYRINFIALAGYMKKIDTSVISRYRNRIINIHPALLPKYGGAGMYGMHVHEAVIRSGEKVSGATVHIVDEVYDHGAILLQRSVPVAPGDSPETLAAKVLAVEHELYPEAIRLFAEGKIAVHDGQVTFAG